MVSALALSTQTPPCDVKLNDETTCRFYVCLSVYLIRKAFNTTTAHSIVVYVYLYSKCRYTNDSDVHIFNYIYLSGYQCEALSPCSCVRLC